MLPINDLATLLEMARRDAQQKQRSIWAISGCAGSGKTTLVKALVNELAQTQPERVIVTAMSGFHLSKAILEERHQLPSKGNKETFDGYGMLRLLQCFAADNQEPLYFPKYDRELLDDPIAAGVYIPSSIRLMLFDGLWLLQSDEPWRQMQSIFTRTFYLELPKDLRLQRLRLRHLATDNKHNPDQVDDHIAHDCQRDLDIQKGKALAQYLIEMDKLQLPS